MIGNRERLGLSSSVPLSEPLKIIDPLLVVDVMLISSAVGHLGPEEKVNLCAMSLPTVKVFGIAWYWCRYRAISSGC